MKTMIRLYIAVVCCLFFVACDMRELCYDHDSHAYKYQVNIEAEYEQEWQYPLIPADDWKENWPDTFNVKYSDFMPLLPSGLRVMVYGAGDYDRQNVSRNGGVVYLSDGEKSFIICNNNTEFLVFSDENSRTDATVTTSQVRRNTYKGVSFAPLIDINTRKAPDVLYVSNVASYMPISSVIPPKLTVLLKPVVYSYYLRLEFDYGIEHVVMARGAMAGMSGSVNLHTCEPGDDLSTVMFDAKVRSFGVDAHVCSFGIPSDFTVLDKQFEDGKYSCGLNIEVALTNGYVKAFEFDITDQIKSQPRGGVIVLKGLRVEDEEAELEGSFDVDVDDWGEDEVVDLPM